MVPDATMHAVIIGVLFHWLVNALFGCRHRKTSFPMTPVEKTASGESGTFVVCLDCGKRLKYDWDRMRSGKPVDEASTQQDTRR